MKTLHELRVCHGDFHPGNYVYKKNNKDLITFLDFELCGYGYYIYELAVFKWDLLNSHTEKFTDSVMNNLIKGYLSVNDDIQNSITYINFFVAIRDFFMLGSSFLFYPE